MTDLCIDQTIHLRAPAKINLGLEIAGKRSDGYHEIVTILQAIDIYDDIVLTPSEQFYYTPDARIPRHDDLIWRTCELLRERLGLRLRMQLRLVKRIPISAGLGGGSSDAGTLLAAIGRLAAIPASELHTVAAELGSDVPFFLRGGTALATGTGTDLEPLRSPADQLPMLLIVPDIDIPRKTATLYSGLSADDFSDGTDTRRIAEQLCQGNPIDPARLRNAFARALNVYAPIHAAHDALKAAGASVVLPSGAGPSLIGIFPSQARAAAALTDWPPDRRFLPRLVAVPR